MDTLEERRLDRPAPERTDVTRQAVPVSGVMMDATDRRPIEDYLPLDALNAIAAREKVHPRRYVELVHYWPARRPITASRAAVYAALVAAPNSDEERAEAADFVAGLAAYEPDAAAVDEARKRIEALHGGSAPKVLDLFAGGGAIPLDNPAPVPLMARNPAMRPDDAGKEVAAARHHQAPADAVEREARAE